MGVRGAPSFGFAPRLRRELTRSPPGLPAAISSSFGTIRQAATGFVGFTAC